MRIAVFGLGYVGSVSAACLAAAGHDIVGVDPDPHKRALIAAGRAPVMEPGLDNLLGRMVRAGRLQISNDTTAAVRAADVSLVCVGTPSRRNGSLDVSQLARVIQDIGVGLAGNDAYHVVAIRSTLLPGVLQEQLIPLLERSSGRSLGVTLGVCVNPEFLREGSAIRDFESPPFTVVGESDSRAGDLLLTIYAHLSAAAYRVQPDEASMVKYASNNFHALKVAFANEIGAMCQPLGIDGQRVMRIFCDDHELNISPRYLRPGFAFGGSCLPKDLRAINYIAKERDLNLPLLGSLASSNDAHIERIVALVLERPRQRVGLIGLSFKVGSDDLRESPFVRLAEALIGKGVRLRIYDPDVALGNVFGRNRAYIEEHLPHVAQLFGGTMADLADSSDLLIVGKRMPGVELLTPPRPGQAIVDLVGIDELETAIRPWAGLRAVSAVVRT